MTSVEFIDSVMIEDPKGYQLHNTKYVKNWVITALVICIVAFILGCIVLGIPDWIYFIPNDAIPSTSIILRNRREGIFQLCHADTTSEAVTCDARDITRQESGTGADGDNYNEIMTWRQVHLSLWVIGLIFLLGAMIALSVLLGDWMKRRFDSAFYSGFRLGIGIALIFTAVILQVAILSYHLVQLREKTRRTTLLPVAFEQWQRSTRITTMIQYGWAYALAWVTTILVWIASWIMVGSYFCWTYEHEEYTSASRKVQYKTSSNPVSSTMVNTVDAFDVLSGRAPSTSELSQRILSNAY